MKNYITLIAILIMTLGAKAQDRGSLLLNVYGGYNFSDRVDFDNNLYVNVGEGFQWGGGLEYFVQPTASVSLNYYRMATSMEAYGPLTWPSTGGATNQLNAGNDSGALNYILLDYAYYFNTGSPTIKPYLGGGLGVGIVETPQNGNDTTFAWDLKLGAKIKTGSPVSVNLQAYLMSMSEAIGTNYYYSGYWGPVAYTNYATLYQFGLGAVISYDFKKNKI